MERKMNWAVWSTGAISHRIIIEMKDSAKMDVVAVCSGKIENAKKFIEETGLETAKAYDNIDEILSRDDIDVVYIASPPWLHKEQCIKCFEAKKAVLCEKPMALNAQEVKDIFESAKKNQVFVAEGIWTNYFPAMKKAKEWIDQGLIGEPVEVVSSFGIPITVFKDRPSPDDPNPPWDYQKEKGGGTLLQFGCYNVNLAQFVFGKKPEEIAGTCEITKGTAVYDNNIAFIMSYDNGAKHASISCSWSARLMSESVINGTEGHIVIGDIFFCPTRAALYRNKDHVWYDDLAEEFIDPYGETGREGFLYQLNAVSDYVANGATESEEASPEHSIMLAETLEEIRRKLGLL